MVKRITVDGIKREVTEPPHYNHDVGARMAFVSIDGKDTPVVASGRTWRVWGPRDRTRPLREAIANGWPKSDDN